MLFYIFGLKNFVILIWNVLFLEWLMVIAEFIHTPMFARIIGISVIFLISLFMSNDKRKIVFKNIFFMFLSIILLGYVLLKSVAGVYIINNIALSVEWLYASSNEGIKFLFGNLADSSGVWGFLFAFKILPAIVFFSAITSLLYYFGVIQVIVHFLGYLVRPIYGTTGPETLCAVANSFLSQTEAPLLIRSYLKSMTESEIFVVMVSGMSTISCSLFAVYGAIGIPLKHMLISSILCVPASLLIAKMWVPATGKEKDRGDVLKESVTQKSFFEALASGTANGLFLALHVGAMLLVVISILFCLNQAISFLSLYFFGFEFTLQSIFGLCMWPAAWALGIQFDEISVVGYLIGTKVAVNEMVAFIALSKMKLAAPTIILTTYALCGFSNFSCIGIQLSSIGEMEEKVRPIISRFGIRAVFAAMFSNLLVAYVMGFFI
jgi:CNT family concentrative nucleoside transporter